MTAFTVRRFPFVMENLINVLTGTLTGSAGKARRFSVTAWLKKITLVLLSDLHLVTCHSHRNKCVSQNRFCNNLRYFSNVLCCVGLTAAHFWTAIDSAPNSLCCPEFKTGLHLEATQFATLVLVAAIPERKNTMFVCL